MLITLTGEQFMSTTQLNTGAGGTWTVDAPDDVTVTPTKSPDGTVVSLDIMIDYTEADFHDPKTGSILSMHFIGPVTDPNGTPTSPGAYPGMVLPTTIEVKNDTTGAINGWTFYNTNDDIASRQPKDFGDAHPDDYAHFHNITPNSFVDANGTPNATITLLDPNFKPAAFGAPGSQLPLAAPAWINADGTINQGATEKLVGLATNGGITIHSEDTPGMSGGSFFLSFYAHAVNPDNPPMGGNNPPMGGNNPPMGGNNPPCDPPPDLLPPISVTNNNTNTNTNTINNSTTQTMSTNLSSDVLVSTTDYNSLLMTS